MIDFDDRNDYEERYYGILTFRWLQFRYIKKTAADKAICNQINYQPVYLLPKLMQIEKAYVSKTLVCTRPVYFFFSTLFTKFSLFKSYEQKYVGKRESNGMKVGEYRMVEMLSNRLMRVQVRESRPGALNGKLHKIIFSSFDLDRTFESYEHVRIERRVRNVSDKLQLPECGLDLLPK